MFENGTFAVLGPDGKQVQCDVLFTYDCEDNGRSYVVFTTGEGAQQRLFANRYDTRADGQLALLALENEQEYAIIKHCFEELKAKLAEQAAAEQAAQAAGAPLFVLDGAVIVGTAAQPECDRLCVVTAPFETSVSRIVARDGISAEMAARRLNAQTPEEALTAQADYVLHNDADLAHLQAEAEKLCEKLLAEGGAGERL